MQQITNGFLKFNNTEIKKEGFHRPETSINVFDTIIKKITVIDACSYDKNKERDAKYFIGYDND